MRKTKLVIDHEIEDSIIGLVTTLKDYKLAWHINQVFKIDLVMQQPLILEFLKGADLEITYFAYVSEFKQFKLVKNKSLEENTGHLIPELINFDYFLMVNGEEEIISNDSVIQGLHKIEGIEYFQLIDVSILKSKDNFLF
ncbi:MAG: IPExxxVDY family protein [Bacteroidota bacterium]